MTTQYKYESFQKGGEINFIFAVNKAAPQGYFEKKSYLCLRF